ncbi:MAG: amino acid ABC transporter ATP-binding protein [Oscillospiraceae bacterium]|nr:amino acid ABC transporter ATP-binding protein [Oscillospiraceae bacterium]
MLEVKDLIKRFSDNTVLDDISLTVRKGEVVVILGPSGCGKSTLLRCINALEDIQGGEILIDGEKILTGGKHNPKVGMVFQSYDLFPHLNVIDNITLAPCKVQKRDKTQVREEARELLKRVGLSGKEKSYPRELSGGQKQRVAIVRSLIMHPELLLFDEVTAALDPEMVREVLEVILDLAKQGKTMMIVTHEMQFARAIADRVILIDGGKKIEENPPERFFTAPETERARQFLNTFTYESVRA